MATRDDALTINVIRKKLNHQYEKNKSKKEEKGEKEKALTHSISRGAVSVLSMAINLLIKTV